jgi:hypothetical protein
MASGGCERAVLRPSRKARLPLLGDVLASALRDCWAGRLLSWLRRGPFLSFHAEKLACALAAQPRCPGRRAAEDIGGFRHLCRTVRMILLRASFIHASFKSTGRRHHSAQLPTRLPGPTRSV